MGCLPHPLPPPPGSHVWFCDIQGTPWPRSRKHSQPQPQPQPRHRCTALLLDQVFRSPVTLQTELYIPCNYAIPVTTRRFLPVRTPAGALLGLGDGPRWGRVEITCAHPLMPRQDTATPPTRGAHPRPPLLLSLSPTSVSLSRLLPFLPTSSHGGRRLRLIQLLGCMAQVT